MESIVTDWHIRQEANGHYFTSRSDFSRKSGSAKMSQSAIRLSHLYKIVLAFDKCRWCNHAVLFNIKVKEISQVDPIVQRCNDGPTVIAIEWVNIGEIRTFNDTTQSTNFFGRINCQIKFKLMS